MRIGSFDTSERVLVIAELGNNHEGDRDAAIELVMQAADCGAGAIKLQTFRTELFVRPADAERRERMSRFELAPDVTTELAELARSLGLLFISTPLDLESAEMLRPLVDAYKVASGDNDFEPLLERLAASELPVILSTGLSDLERVERAARHFQGRELAILQCTSAYPAPAEEANLAVIGALAERFDCTPGYSDHTLGIDACLAAVAAGARVLEKHFTLDKEHSDFRDHALSADPPELRELVAGVRRVETLLGDSVKRVQPSEEALTVAARRSIVAARDLAEGATIAAGDLGWLRPADGLAPGSEAQLVGRRLKRAVAAGESIRPEDAD